MGFSQLDLLLALLSQAPLAPGLPLVEPDSKASLRQVDTGHEQTQADEERKDASKHDDGCYFPCICLDSSHGCELQRLLLCVFLCVAFTDSLLSADVLKPLRIIDSLIFLVFLFDILGICVAIDLILPWVGSVVVGV